VALADVYDALTSKRPYRAMGTGVGGHHRRGPRHPVRPGTGDAFLANEEVFDRIRRFQEFEEHPESIEQLFQDGIRPLADTVADAG